MRRRRTSTNSPIALLSAPQSLLVGTVCDLPVSNSHASGQLSLMKARTAFRAVAHEAFPTWFDSDSP